MRGRRRGLLALPGAVKVERFPLERLACLLGLIEVARRVVSQADAMLASGRQGTNADVVCLVRGELELSGGFDKAPLG